MGIPIIIIRIPTGITATTTTEIPIQVIPATLEAIIPIDRAEMARLAAEALVEAIEAAAVLAVAVEVVGNHINSDPDEKDIFFSGFDGHTVYG